MVSAPIQRPDALDVENLRVRFGAHEVIGGLSFRVPAGTSLAVIGPNGAGKTVLFRALLDCVPHEGTVRWAPGTRIGYVPQKLDLERDIPLTGIEFLRARARASGAPRAEVSHALERTGLVVDVARKPIGALSGGQLQRLLVAFALVGTPNVLLLDEPTAGVDQPGQERLNDLVHRLRDEEGMTILLISHDLSVVYLHATNVLCMTRNQPCLGPPTEILTPERLQDLYGTGSELHVHDAPSG